MGDSDCGSFVVIDKKEYEATCPKCEEHTVLKCTPYKTMSGKLIEYSCKKCKIGIKPILFFGF